MSIKKNVSLVSLILAVFLLVSCQPIEYYLEMVYKVHGNVTRAGSGPPTVPLVSVEVYVGDYQYSELTNSHGDYEMELPEGTWTLQFEKYGYTTETYTVPVGPDNVRELVDMELHPLGGTVTVVLINAGDSNGDDFIFCVVPRGGDPSNPADYLGTGGPVMIDDGTATAETAETFMGGLELEMYPLIDENNNGVPDVGEFGHDVTEFVVAGDVTLYVDYNDMRPIGGGENNPPEAEFSAYPMSGPVPLAVQFISVSSDPDGDTLSYEWDFAGYATSTLENPLFEFTNAGYFPVSLTVEDGRSGTDTVTHFIEVFP